GQAGEMRRGLVDGEDGADLVAARLQHCGLGSADGRIPRQPMQFVDAGLDLGGAEKAGEEQKAVAFECRQLLLRQWPPAPLLRAAVDDGIAAGEHGNLAYGAGWVKVLTVIHCTLLRCCRCSLLCRVAPVTTGRAPQEAP